MPHTDFSLSSSVLIADRPRCSHCGAPMWLVRITPAGPYVNQRVFKCPACEIAEDGAVKPD